MQEILNCWYWRFKLLEKTQRASRIVLKKDCKQINKNNIFPAIDATNITFKQVNNRVVRLIDSHHSCKMPFYASKYKINKFGY